MMKKLSVKAKVFSLVVMATFGTIFLLSMIILNAQQGKKSLNDFISEAVTPINKFKSLEDDIRWTYQNIIEVSGEFSATVASHTEMEKRIKKIDIKLTKLNENIFIENKSNLVKVEKDWKLYKDVLEKKILPAYYEDDLELVLEIAEDEALIHYFNIEKTFEKLKKTFDKAYDIIIENSAKEIENKLYISIGITLILLLLFWSIGYYITSFQVIRPLENFQNGLLDFFKYLNRETNNIVELEIKNDDEIGKMARLVNENIENTKKFIEEDKIVINEVSLLVRDITSGKLTGRLEHTSHNPAVKDLVIVINQMMNNLESVIEHILSVLKEYQENNFQAKTNLECTDEIKDLTLGINTLGDTISNMLVENYNNGTALTSSAQELLSNVDTLNNSSQFAAASLEETSASLIQITSNIRGNVSNISTITDFSHNLTLSSNEGHALANDTTIAMEEINKQVNLINDSITVIDKIAFQTNILSLNAAVEAATAGEAGKGFAVVAQEVRNLASRSAQAAKEIKNLVEHAKTKADEGKIIANKMIGGYKNLNENINKTMGLIDELSTTSKEQLEGIEQINEAVIQLDSKTQENLQVANKTQDVAIGTSKIATQIVDNVEEKKFIGKN